MSQRSNFLPPGGPSYHVPLNERTDYMGPAYTANVTSGPDYKGPDYVEPISEQPVFTSYDYAKPISAQRVHTGHSPNHLMYTERGVDWIHSGRYPLSQQPGFEMQHNFLDAGPGYKGPISAQRVHTGPGPNSILYREKGVDWIHNGRYPLSQQPGFEMQHNFMWVLI